MPEPATRAYQTSRADEPPASGLTRRCPTCGAEYPIDFLVCPKDATPLERPAGGGEDPLLGEVLAGTFCMTRVLGEGGMGRVYEAEHVRLPRRFAVKVMQESLAENPEALARFEREAQVVARIASEHVLEVVDVVKTRDGRPCIVSELLEGEELGDVADRLGRCDLSQAIDVCRQVCRGLAAAHALGVIHRDLKPSNLYLVKRADGGMHVKILDFGVAKVNDGADLTRTGMVVGTPAYMSPEQGRGAADVDARTDIYSVGAVLYRLLTGEPPFGDADPAVVLTRLLTEDPKRPREIHRSIPEGVELLVQRAMARSPAHRPSTALELERLLAAFADPRSDLAPAVSVRTGSMHSEGLGTMDTVALGAPKDEATEVTRRARRARPLAMMLVLGVSLLAGASALAAGVGAVRVVASRAKPTDVELALAGALAAVVTLATITTCLRALVSRWRSAPTIERLVAGLARALVAPLALLGGLALAWQLFGVLGPATSAEQQAIASFSLVALPALLGAVVLALAVRRAGRM